jgi:hypothetical protein
MIILTQEILDAVGVCADGQRVAEEFNCIGIDLAIGIKIMEDNNTGYANWARGLYSNRIALKLSNHYEYIQYLVFDPVNKIFKATTNESDVLGIKQQIIEDNPEVDQSQITMYEEIKSLDGIVHRFPLV